MCEIRGVLRNFSQDKPVAFRYHLPDELLSFDI